MDNRLWTLIDKLSENEFRTAENLGKTLFVSERTIRTRVKELNGYLEAYDSKIVSKSGFGYYLKINTPEMWSDFLNKRNEITEEIPTDAKERMDYLLAVFLNRTDYIKSEELCDFLYVSSKTLSNELKKVAFILNQFGIEFERKPYYGIRAVGNEFNKRCCILQHFLLTDKSFFELRRKQEILTRQIADILSRLASKYNVMFSETAFQSTVLYIYISLSRIRKGLYIISGEEVSSEKKEIQLAKELRQELIETEHTDITEAETYYMGIYIAGKRFIGNGIGTEPNFIISEKIDALVTRILEEIYQTYNIELRDNLNLRIMLSQHLLPLEIRLKYGIPVENAMLEEVKEKHFFPYTIAQQAAHILSEAYGKLIPEDEMAYIAIYIALALEENKGMNKKKKNVLLVCVSGKASSQLLMYRFRHEFEEYIDSLYVCSMYDFDNYDLSEIDIIFTTVTIYKKVTVPIFEIHDFLESNEIMTVRHFLQVGDMNFIFDFFREKYFYANVTGETKEEVIRSICTRISLETEIPDGFYESVLSRENLGSTDFGNLIAIPHPTQSMTKETVIAIAVLPKEILWSTNMVRVVVLTSLSEEKSEDTQKFYEILSKFLVSKSAVGHLIKNPTFETFIQLLLEEGERK